MDRIEVGTVVYLSPEEVYRFLIDFPRYADYSEHLREVRSHGDGSPGTEYDLEFAWWRVSHTVRSRVTGVEPPERIDWTVTEGVDASGRWLLERVEAPPDRTAATDVRLVVEYDPASASPAAIDLPALTSMDWLVDRVEPVVVDEAGRVVERIVADLEGERRPVELVVHETPSS